MYFQEGLASKSRQIKVYLVPRVEVIRSEPTHRPQTPEFTGQGKRAKPQAKGRGPYFLFYLQEPAMGEVLGGTKGTQGYERGYYCCNLKANEQIVHAARHCAHKSRGDYYQKIQLTTESADAYLIKSKSRDISL